MAKQKIVWTVLPYGYVPDGPRKGCLRLSIVVSPRLTPQAANEQVLAAFPEFLDWPDTLAGLKFAVEAGSAKIAADVISQTDASVWKDIFDAATFVDGFKFTDMRNVNLRSFAVRNVLKFVREKYEQLATTAGSERPRLLPWRDADPALKGMLEDLGVRTHKVNLGDRQVELPLPGFERFFDDKSRERPQRLVDQRVFSKQGIYGPPAFTPPVVGIDGNTVAGTTPIRALPPDWNPPAGGPDAAVMSQFRSAAEYDFYQANRFYARSENRTAYERIPSLAAAAPRPKPPQFDFHRIIASFGDYPALLRALGLVIDIALPADSAANPLLAALAASPQGQLDGVVGLLPSWEAAHDPADDAYPRTAFRLTRQRFLPRPRGAELRDGLLHLEGAGDHWGKGKSDYDVYQVDPDGAALKTTDFLLTAQNLVARSLDLKSDGRVTYTTGDRQAVAALRSGSIGVSCHGRAGRIALAAASAALKNDAFETSAAQSRKVVLFAEDVLRGYRVDVFTVSSGKWNSLNRRIGAYRLTKPDRSVDFGADEGYVKGPSTTSSEGTDEHYLHESLFRWAGWSLAAPRPGRTIIAEDGAGPGLQRERVGHVDEVAPNGSGVAARFVAEPRSLPRLRFGERYRFRARVVDLAGNSLALDDPSLGEFEQATNEVDYLRFEPVDPPALVQRDRLSEGESLERVVIRSNTDIDPESYLATPAFAAAIADPASAGFDYVADAVRHVVPPKTAQLQAEMHRLFDQAIGGAPADALAAYTLITEREPLSLFDVPGVMLVTPPSTTQATSTALPLALPGPGNPTGDRLAGGQYIIYPDTAPSAVLPTPYLPDDVACGIALRRVPGVTQPMSLGPGAAIVRAPNEELVLLVVFSGRWPDRTGLRIVVRERTAALDAGVCGETFADDGTPKWDPDARTLTLFVAKGRIERMRYSSFVFTGALASFGLRPDDPLDYLATLGIPSWITSSGARQQVQAMAALGCHWMITPDRPLVLVHATQQPVCSPQFLALSNNRPAGATFTDLSARLRMHGPSTGKFEIVADWSEIVDDPLRGPPERVAGEGQLGEINVPENFGNLFGLDEMIALNEQATIANLANPPMQQQRTRADQHEFGDTRFRLVRYRIRATTRFTEYLPAKLAEDRNNIIRLGDPVPGVQADRGALDDLGAPVLLNTAAGKREGFIVVPNSARPASPSLVYVLPTMRWAQDKGIDKARQSSTRNGNGLRVYLDRPWFSSGDGELLGVVILGDGMTFKSIPDAMKPFVTQWGLDPIFDSLLPKEQTRITDFPLRVTAETVTLEESATPVTAVGHRVQWDGDRGLWYCDIELDPGRNYMPFVRLALVRYQPHSRPDAKVSRVVLAEFAQLLPRRALVLDRSRNTIKLTLRGPAPEMGSMKFPPESQYLNISFIPNPLGPPPETGRNRLEVVLQVRDAGVDSDLAWSDAAVLTSVLLDPPGEGSRGGAPIARSGARPAGVSVATGPNLTNVLSGAGVAVTPSAAGSPGAVAGPAVTLAPGILELIDPTLWTGTVTLPALTKPSRLAIREFERYYSDRSVPEVRGNQTLQRRIVEERLVYAECFALN